VIYLVFSHNFYSFLDFFLSPFDIDLDLDLPEMEIAYGRTYEQRERIHPCDDGDDEDDKMREKMTDNRDEQESTCEQVQADRNVLVPRREQMKRHEDNRQLNDL